MQKTISLNQITTISAGYSFRGKIPEISDGGVLAVQMKDVSLLEGIDWTSCVRTELPGKKQPDWLQPKDILLVSRGEKNYAVMVGEEVQAQDIQAVAAPYFFHLRVNSPLVLPEYLWWYLNQKPCQQYFEQNAEGTAIKGIRRGVMELTSIPVPELTKQHVIVSLANNARQQQLRLIELLTNTEQIMSCIASDLFTTPTPILS